MLYLAAVLVVLALCVKPLRKATGIGVSAKEVILLALGGRTRGF
jgi:hypothetical protein